MKFDRGLAACILAPLFIALSIMAVREAGREVPPLSIAALGSLLAVPFLYLMSALNGKKADVAQVLKLAPRPFWQVLWTRGVIGQLLIVWGFTLTTGVKSILLLRLEPLFVLLWSVFLLKERPTPGKFFLMLLLVAGAACVVLPGSSISALNTGDLLIICSLLFLSFSYIPTQAVVQKANPEGFNILISLIGGIILLLVSIAMYGSQALPSSFESAAAIFAYTITFFVIGVSLYLFAFKTVKPWIIASFLSLEVVFGLSFALTLGSERLEMCQIAGTLLLMITTLLIAHYRRKEEQELPLPESQRQPVLKA